MRPPCKKRSPRQPGKIIDLFAGAGGWAEGLRMLGLSALGIETDEWACATSRAAGHDCLQADVAALDPATFGEVWGVIGSPPCQAYSSAGKGLGRQDKPLVIACAHELAAGNDSRQERLAECRDSRSLLTVEPLRYVLALRPRWVALEQVPAVLELWSLFAGLLAGHGYHTSTGVLSAERYGVPQTRKRAFLLASLDGPLQLPPPTHRSYNPRRKEIPDDELALQPWVSMAQALGWGMTDRPGTTVVAGNKLGGTGAYACEARAQRTGNWVQRPSHPCVQIRRSGDRIEEGFDPTEAPAQAVTTRVNRWQAHDIDPGEGEGGDWTGQRPAPTLVTTRRSKDGALVGRQLPPGESVERGGWAWRNGTQANAAVRGDGEPAPTVHFGHALNQVEWIPCEDQHSRRSRSTASWARERPATTVACDRRVHPPGHKQNSGDPPGRYEQRRGANAVRVTVEQAAILQGFPAGYPWQGSRTRQFCQLGNAVPPPVARRVLEQAIAPSFASSARRVRRPKTQSKEARK